MYMNCYKHQKRTLKTCESNKFSKNNNNNYNQFQSLSSLSIQASFCVCCVIYTCTSSGAPNDGFFLNAMETLFRLSRVFFRSVEMHSQRRYKICICSVSLGQLESFPTYKGLSIISLKILDAI